tara:strand:- start:115 stop:645 length:531 start_codon:yes stop_codon:yes gene_type:complete
MPNYFSNFPKMYYDAVGNGDYKVVTNLLRRVQLTKGFKDASAFFDEINIDDTSTPEILADQFYGSVKYYWVVLLFNNVRDRFYDWPMSTVQLQNYIEDKYGNPDGVHHYEITQTSGKTSSNDESHVIQVNSTAAGALPVTNSEYEQRRQLKKQRIKMLKPEFLELFTDEFNRLIGE